MEEAIKMNTNKKKIIGIDVSKQTLDVSIYDGSKHEQYRVRNKFADFESKILSKLSNKNMDDLLFVLENTGTYHLKLANGLYERGYEISVENPFKVKKYSEMLLCRSKTDAVDAKIIAEFGYNIELNRYEPKSKEMSEIDQCLKAIEDFHKTISQMTSQIESLQNNPIISEVVLSNYEMSIKELKDKIKELESEIERIIKSHYLSEYKLLLGIPGVGKRLAAGVISVFGDRIGKFSNAKKMSSYLGLNPSIKESGTSVRGRGSIAKRGNRYLRKLLYMASLSAKKYNKSCKELYERLLSKGKAKKLALIAVAHKLLRQIYAILLRGVAYDENYSGKILTNI